jgi:trk system potassium uptake protein TrkA
MERKMKVILIGCDQLAAELAYRLSQHGNEVVVVDREQSAFVKLNPNFRGRVHEGDALNEDVLIRAGIKKADVFLALTRSDSTNYVLGLSAREMYKIPQVIVRNNDPLCQGVCEHMGLQAVSSAIWGAEQLEEMIYQDAIAPLLTMGGGEVEIYAVRVSKLWDGCRLDELLEAEGNQRFVSLTRSGISSIPKEDVTLREDDLVYIAADHSGIEKLRDRLESGSKEGA